VTLLDNIGIKFEMDHTHVIAVVDSKTI